MYLEDGKTSWSFPEWGKSTQQFFRENGQTAWIWSLCSSITGYLSNQHVLIVDAGKKMNLVMWKTDTHRQRFCSSASPAVRESDLVVANAHAVSSQRWFCWVAWEVPCPLNYDYENEHVSEKELTSSKSDYTTYICRNRWCVRQHLLDGLNFFLPTTFLFGRKLRRLLGNIALWNDNFVRCSK